MNVMLELPELKWDKFTDNHSAIRCHVHDLKLDYEIVSYYGADLSHEGIFLCYVYDGRKDKKDRLELLGKGYLDDMKKVAERHYEEQSIIFLNNSSNFFIYQTQKVFNN
jgi:hypothetical protein